MSHSSNSSTAAWTSPSTLPDMKGWLKVLNEEALLELGREDTDTQRLAPAHINEEQKALSK